MSMLNEIGKQVHKAIMDGVEPTDDIAKQIVDIFKLCVNGKVASVNTPDTRDTPVNNNTVVSSELLQLAKQYSEREQN